jgi:hypothetical protein
MQTMTYRQVLYQALQLTPDEKLQLIGELAANIRQQITTQPQHSIMEFEGLGKEVWQGIDVEKYIEEERNSWE